MKSDIFTKHNEIPASWLCEERQATRSEFGVQSGFCSSGEWAMGKRYATRVVVYASVWVTMTGCATTSQPETIFEGTWRMTSYLKADNGTRYQTDGYMMFDKTHWMHLMYLNRNERSKDFSESHHGTYEITGPGEFTMNIDMEIHTDPISEDQDTPVWYGPVGSQEGVDFRAEGDRLIIDTTTGAQIVLEKIE